MTKLIHMTGDIFDTDAKGIGHGINAKGVMGAGIALQFKLRFPEMYQTYKNACTNGTIKGGNSYPWILDQGEAFVFNICSQEEPGANASYDFLIQGVKQALSQAAWYGVKTIALPRIGSGIGGLDEGLVETILTYLAEGSDVDIELWTYKA